jgi:hypothetical protein
MGSWTEKFKDGVELDKFGSEMVRFLEKLKLNIYDIKLVGKIKRYQKMFLENPEELDIYVKGVRK